MKNILLIKPNMVIIIKKNLEIKKLCMYRKKDLEHI